MYLLGTGLFAVIILSIVALPYSNTTTTIYSELRDLCYPILHVLTIHLSHSSVYSSDVELSPDPRLPETDSLKYVGD